jgi:hypothetical protein
MQVDAQCLQVRYAPKTTPLLVLVVNKLNRPVELSY